MTSRSSSRCAKVIACLVEILWSPVLSGALLLAIKYNDPLREAFPFFTHTCALIEWTKTSCLSDLVFIKTILWSHLVLATLRNVNRLLNTMASNSWRLGSVCCAQLCCKRGSNSLQDEIAVVTGGSSGIGKSLVEKMVRKGLNVAVLDIQDLPKSLQDEPRVRFYRCDVTNSESVAAAADAVRKELGHPSILINNAGIVTDSTILDTSEAFLRKIFGVNLLALWLTTQQFLPNMIQQNKGHVVTVASMASFVSLTTAADYSATKAGALAFHESLTAELRHCYKAPNVLTTVVHPNFVRTPLIEHLSNRLERSGVNMLTSEHVAEDILAGLCSNKGGQLVVPKHMSLVTSFRAWPAWMQHGIRDILGHRASKM